MPVDIKYLDEIDLFQHRSLVHNFRIQWCISDEELKNFKFGMRRTYSLVSYNQI